MHITESINNFIGGYNVAVLDKGEFCYYYAFRLFEIGLGMVLCTWAYFGFFVGLLIDSSDLLFDDKCKFDIERVTIEPNFRDAVSEEAPRFLRLSMSVVSDLDDVGVPGNSLIDLRTLAGTVSLVTFDTRPKLMSFVDNRRALNDGGNVCYKERRWMNIQECILPARFFILHNCSYFLEFVQCFYDVYCKHTCFVY